MPHVNKCPSGIEFPSVQDVNVVSSAVTITRLVKTRIRVANGSPTTISQPYRSVTITAISADVTIDGQAVPLGFTDSISSNENEQYVQDTVVTGADYYVTVTRVV